MTAYIFTDDRLAERESSGQIDLAAHVVPVRVGNDRLIDLPVPERHHRAQFSEQLLAVIASVD